MKSTEYVRVGIIGVGNIGSVHAAKIYGGQVDGLLLTALCDVNEARRARLKEEYPEIPLFSDSDELIESGLVDAVIIATPHYDHPKIAIKAFECGLHVLTEKPVGVYCQAAKEMIDAAEKSGKVFAVMFNQRTNKLFSEARRIVASGELGEVKRSVWIVTNWYRKQCYYDSGDWRATWSGEGGGVLMNQAPHNLDLWQWICGMPTEIRAQCDVAKFHRIEVEDDATVFARYKNGATGVFITSTGDYPGTNRLEISGTRGKLVIEKGKLTLTTLPMDEREYNLSPADKKIEPVVTEITDEPYNGHVNILKNFARAILFGDELIARGEEGIAELTLCNAAYMSAWTDKPVSLPLDDELYLKMLKEKICLSREKNSSQEEASTEADYKNRWDTNW